MRRIYPLFLPFAGCPQRCLFCAQNAQTGRSTEAVADMLRRADQELATWPPDQGVFELAFFGGTFTLLPQSERQACLDFFQRWQSRGLFSSFRCSTRPDALNPALLDELRKAGCSTVELGVQSFQDTALKLSGRGYTGSLARKACSLVLGSGMALGIQLMPGMPGLDLAGANRDIDDCLALSPTCARLYPCLVIRGTALEDIWRAGRYQPWEFEVTLAWLARACRALEENGCAVIRMGLAPEADLEMAVLAGPRHPEMGNMARGLALLEHVREQLESWQQETGYEVRKALLLAPRRVQGMFWGHAGTLEGAYADMGLRRRQVRWQDRDNFLLGIPKPVQDDITQETLNFL
ncbi:radical SAM protein [Desulfovibrio sp. OttesenSCG-928-F20]|nr:radical SAM protein [Desulfovibrio sp. OttesenSCG-928-F20]